MEALGPDRELIASKIFELLNVEKVLGRRCIQTHLVGVGGFRPKQLTDTLEILAASERLERKKCTGVGFIFHMYALPGTDREAIDKCERDIIQGHEILRSAKLGKVGERYVRAVMLRSHSFFKITRKRRVGKIVATDGTKIDMTARLTWDPQIRVVVEVKNEYEIFPQSDQVFWRLASTAIAENSLPILAAVNVSDAARTSCEHLGIFLFELGRQIFPKSLVNAKLDHLEKVFGPQKYEQVESNRPIHRPDDITPSIQRDIDFMAGHDRINKALSRWVVTEAQLKKANCKPSENVSLDELVEFRAFYRTRLH